MNIKILMGMSSYFLSTLPANLFQEHSNSRYRWFQYSRIPGQMDLKQCRQFEAPLQLSIGNRMPILQMF